MSNTNVLTLRIPSELKKRLEREARYQGISINQLTNYILATQLAQMEILSSLEFNLSRKSIPDLKKKAKLILDKVQDRPVPDWDRID
jgi:hypothetical protein